MKALLALVSLVMASTVLLADESNPTEGKSTATTSVPTNSAIAKQRRWTFELITVILSATTNRPFLSLEDLNTYSEMPSDAPTACLEQERDGRWQLVIRNAHNYQTQRERGIKLWETRSAGEAAEPAGLAGLPFERTGFYKLRKEDIPITVLLPQWGLLQVSGFNEQAESAVLHYKRVVAATGSGGSGPIMHGPAE